jgi:hypothetical protein
MGRPRLTPDQERIVREAIAGGATQREAAELVGIRVGHLEQILADELRDLRVGRGRQRDSLQTRKRDELGRVLPIDELDDITPEEIAARAAAIRATWDEERHRQAWNPTFRGPIEPG